MLSFSTPLKKQGIFFMSVGFKLLLSHTHKQHIQAISFHLELITGAIAVQCSKM